MNGEGGPGAAFDQRTQNLRSSPDGVVARLKFRRKDGGFLATEIGRRGKYVHATGWVTSQRNSSAADFGAAHQEHDAETSCGGRLQILETAEDLILERCDQCGFSTSWRLRRRVGRQWSSADVLVEDVAA